MTCLRSYGAEFHAAPEAGTINIMMMHEDVARKGLHLLDQALSHGLNHELRHEWKGKTYCDFAAPHLKTQLRLYVGVRYERFVR